jgi:hypothetical protein
LEGQTSLMPLLWALIFIGRDWRGHFSLGRDASLHTADLRDTYWTEARDWAAPAHFADFRGAEGVAQALTQAHFDGLIGNQSTLLPSGTASDTGEPFFVWSCWEKPPGNLDAIVNTVAGPSGTDPDRAALRSFFDPQNPRRKTGTPLPVDAPYPEGHPLAERR